MTHENLVIIILVVGYHPVVEVIKDKGTGKEDDGYEENVKEDFAVAANDKDDGKV